MSEYQALSHQIGNLNDALRDLVGEFSGFRGEIKAGFDGMDRRVQNLETDMRRLVSDQVAQDVITPKVFLDIDELKSNCSARHEQLDRVVDSMRADDAKIQRTIAHGEGERDSKARIGSMAWVALCAIAAAAAWAWEHWFGRLAGGSK